MTFSVNGLLPIARLGCLIFVFACLFAFLNRSPYGEPSRVIAYFVEQNEMISSSIPSLDIDGQKSLDVEQEEKQPKKTWKKYVLDKIILQVSASVITEKEENSYQLRGIDRHSLSHRFSGLAPPFSS